MQERARAEEHLRVIRSLMERATIYRAISAPSALLGGALAVGLDVALTCLNVTDGITITLLWVAVCAIVVTGNFVFLYRDAQRRGEPFLSSGMKVAMRAVAPSFAVGALTILPATSEPHIFYPLWCLCYGLGLLAAAHFAPASIRWLGRAFWAAGIAFIFLEVGTMDNRGRIGESFAFTHLMGLTFGLFHLVYAACVWPRRAEAPAALDLPEPHA